MKFGGVILLAIVLCHGVSSMFIPEKYEEAYWEIEKLIMKDERLGAKFLRLGMIIVF